MIAEDITDRILPGCAPPTVGSEALETTPAAGAAVQSASGKPENVPRSTLVRRRARQRHAMYGSRAPTTLCRTNMTRRRYGIDRVVRSGEARSRVAEALPVVGPKGAAVEVDPLVAPLADGRSTGCFAGHGVSAGALRAPFRLIMPGSNSKQLASRLPPEQNEGHDPRHLSDLEADE